MRAARRLVLAAVVPVSMVVSLMVGLPSASAIPTPVGLSATIDSPSEGDQVAGDQVYVEAESSLGGATGIGQLDHMSLLVDGTDVDDEYCDNSPDEDCSVEFLWSTAGEALGAHTLTTTVTTDQATIASSADVHVTLADLAVSITSPTNLATVAGHVTVTATATGSPSLGDPPYDMLLLVDGESVGDVVSCTVTGNSCTGAMQWDAGSLSGSHDLQVLVGGDLNGNAFAASSRIYVKVSNLPPSAAIQSTFPAVVRGTVSVTGYGTVGTPGNDVPSSLQLIVDGAPSGVASCYGETTTCTRSLLWDTAGLLGRHNVQVQFTTGKTSVLSPIQAVTIAPPLSQPGETILQLMPGNYAHGRLSAWTQVRDAQGHDIAGAPVTVAFTPAVGAPVRVTALTDANGVAIISAKLKQVNTKVVASLGPDYWSVHLVNRVWVNRPVTCSVPAVVHHAVSAKVACKVPGMPNGTTVTLHYSSLQSGSHVLTRAKAKSGKVTFTFTISKKSQRLQLWATTPDTKAYAGSASRPAKLHVI